MEYSKLVAVTGLPGLYELINSKTDGAIVRNLDDKTTRFVASRVHHFSHLESIEVFTTGENVNLVDIFHAMEKESGVLPDVKDDAAIKKYFQKAYPELDFERVYASDLKKMVKWFDILKKNNIEIKLAEPPAEEEPALEEPEEIKAPAPKAKAKKEEPVKEIPPAKEVKKAAPKKEEPEVKPTAKEKRKETPKKTEPEEKLKKVAKKTEEKAPKKKK